MRRKAGEGTNPQESRGRHLRGAGVQISGQPSPPFNNRRLFSGWLMQQKVMRASHHLNRVASAAKDLGTDQRRPINTPQRVTHRGSWHQRKSCAFHLPFPRHHLGTIYGTPKYSISFMLGNSIPLFAWKAYLRCWSSLLPSLIERMSESTKCEECGKLCAGKYALR